MAHRDTLIFDIGFHNGDDSAYYLARGYRVVAVEANPALVEQGRSRFRAETASGALTILNLAICETGGTSVQFWVNDTDPNWSSVDPGRARRGGKFHSVEVEGISPARLFRDYGIPWYLKIDIEGSDEIVLRSLPRDGARPEFVSCEPSYQGAALDLLVAAGYTGFKLINPGTFTQSVPIFSDEIFLRALRKASTLYHPFQSAIAALPRGLRPRKTIWDPPRSRLSYAFSDSSTGPFGNETDGDWLTAAQMKSHLTRLYAQYERDAMIETFWFDLHAR